MSRYVIVISEDAMVYEDLETLRRQAARVVTVRDVSGTAGFYLSAIRRAAGKRGLPVILGSDAHRTVCARLRAAHCLRTIVGN